MRTPRSQPAPPSPTAAWCDALDRVVDHEIAAHLPVEVAETLVLLGLADVAERFAAAGGEPESRALTWVATARGYARLDDRAGGRACWRRALAELEEQGDAVHCWERVVAWVPLDDTRTVDDLVRAARRRPHGRIRACVAHRLLAEGLDEQAREFVDDLVRAVAAGAVGYGNEVVWFATARWHARQGDRDRAEAIVRAAVAHLEELQRRSIADEPTCFTSAGASLEFCEDLALRAQVIALLATAADRASLVRGDAVRFLRDDEWAALTARVEAVATPARRARAFAVMASGAADASRARALAERAAREAVPVVTVHDPTGASTVLPADVYGAHAEVMHAEWAAGAVAQARARWDRVWEELSRPVAVDTVTQALANLASAAEAGPVAARALERAAEIALRSVRYPDDSYSVVTVAERLGVRSDAIERLRADLPPPAPTPPDGDVPSWMKPKPPWDRLPALAERARAGALEPVQREFLDVVAAALADAGAYWNPYEKTGAVVADVLLACAPHDPDRAVLAPMLDALVFPTAGVGSSVRTRRARVVLGAARKLAGTELHREGFALLTRTLAAHVPGAEEPYADAQRSLGSLDGHRDWARAWCAYDRLDVAEAALPPAHAHGADAEPGAFLAVVRAYAERGDLARAEATFRRGLAASTKTYVVMDYWYSLGAFASYAAIVEAAAPRVHALADRLWPRGIDAWPGVPAAPWSAPAA